MAGKGEVTRWKTIVADPFCCQKSYDAAAKELREMDWNKFIQDTIDKGLKK